MSILYIYIYIYIYYFAILQKLTQHCKLNTHQFFLNKVFHRTLFINSAHNTGYLLRKYTHNRNTSGVQGGFQNFLFSLCNFHSEFYIEFRQAILSAFSVSVLRFRSWPQSPKTFMPYPSTYISRKKQGQIRA